MSELLLDESPLLLGRCVQRLELPLFTLRSLPLSSPPMAPSTCVVFTRGGASTGGVAGVLGGGLTEGVLPVVRPLF